MQIVMKMSLCKKGWNCIKSIMTRSLYLPFLVQADESSAIRIIMSMSHPGLAKNISEQAFGKNLKIIPAAGAGMYILFNMFRD